jgi:hypothetical protein
VPAAGRRAGARLARGSSGVISAWPTRWTTPRCYVPPRARPVLRHRLQSAPFPGAFTVPRHWGWSRRWASSWNALGGDRVGLEDPGPRAEARRSTKPQSNCGASPRHKVAEPGAVPRYASGRKSACRAKRRSAERRPDSRRTRVAPRWLACDASCNRARVATRVGQVPSSYRFGVPLRKPRERSQPTGRCGIV